MLIESLPKKKVIAILCILVLGIHFYPMVTRDFTLHFIDVGQGDSCFIMTKHNKKILIDGGGSESSSFDVGEKTLIPYLLNQGVYTLDYVMISHFDTDHCGGVLSVLESLNVKMVMIPRQEEESWNYQRFKNIVKQKRIKVKVVKAGDRIKVDKDTYFDILWPQEKQIAENRLNNNSIVAKLVYKNTSMLFTGDIEAIAEKEMVEKYKKSSQLKSTILKVAHHGSKSSSIEELLGAVSPKIAFIGVGENNKFGHPNEGVLERLEEKKCQMYRTDQDGEITIKIKQNGSIKITKMLN